MLSAPGGAILAAGRTGATRRSLITLAAALHRMEIFSPKLTRQYSTKHFAADLRGLLQRVGVEGTPTLLILEDHQLPSSTFTEMINSLLSTGEIPGLFRPEELDALLPALKERAAEAGWRDSLFSFFTFRVRSFLRVALILDTAAPTFVPVCEANPAFYARCTIHWMEEFRPESTTQIPAIMLSGDPLGLGDDSLVSRRLAAVHARAMGFGGTPHHYTSLILAYVRLLV